MEDAADRSTEPRSKPDIPKAWNETTYALAWKFLWRFQNIPEEDREDIIQDFAIKNRTFEKFHGKSKFSTWLYSGLSNQARDFLKKRDQTRVEPKKRRETVELDAPQKKEEGKKTRELEARPQKHEPFLYWVEYTVACFEAGEELTEYIHEKLGPPPHSFEALLTIGMPYEQDRLTKEYRKHQEMCVACTVFREQSFEMMESADGFVHFHEKWTNFLEENHPRQLQYQLLYDSPKESKIVKTKRQRVCQNCGKPGHNQRTCTHPKENTDK